MVTLLETEQFAAWLAGLRDAKARDRILVRLRRLMLGNPGDVRPLGGGVSELRIHWGPGYRVYFVTKGRQLIILLGGGTKDTQARDIREALRLARAI